MSFAITLTSICTGSCTGGECVVHGGREQIPSQYTDIAAGYGFASPAHCIPDGGLAVSQRATNPAKRSRTPSAAPLSGESVGMRIDAVNHIGGSIGIAVSGVWPGMPDTSAVRSMACPEPLGPAETMLNNVSASAATLGIRPAAAK